jgi:hypothetical protein
MAASCTSLGSSLTNAALDRHHREERVVAGHRLLEGHAVVEAGDEDVMTLDVAGRRLEGDVDQAARHLGRRVDRRVVGGEHDRWSWRVVGRRCPADGRSERHEGSSAETAGRQSAGQECAAWFGHPAIPTSRRRAVLETASRWRGGRLHEIVTTSS